MSHPLTQPVCAHNQRFDRPCTPCGRDARGNPTPKPTLPGGRPPHPFTRWDRLARRLLHYGAVTDMTVHHTVAPDTINQVTITISIPSDTLDMVVRTELEHEQELQQQKGSAVTELPHYYDKKGAAIDLDTFGELMNRRDYARVGRTELPGGWTVSTVWVGIAHRFDEDGRPLIFETMVFPKDSRDETDMVRYSSLEDATAGHEEMVRRWTDRSRDEDQ